MEKDYWNSNKYTKDEFDHLRIGYKFRDFCQDQYADFLSCQRLCPQILESKIYYTSCKLYRKRWEKCQDYREKQVFEELKKMFDDGKINV